MQPTITIIGSGFVGSHFIDQYHSYFSNIVTTSKQSKKNPFSNHHIHFDIYETIPPLPATDLLIIAIPFSRTLTEPTKYLEGIKNICDSIEKYKKVIFLSSTSVYPLLSKEIDEKSITANNNRSNVLTQCEKLIQNLPATTFVLRLGGICGYERNSMNKITSLKINNGNLPVNLIHVDDIIQFIMQLIQKNYSSDTINICCTDHPEKKDYYSYLCQLFNYPPPQFTVSNEPYKIVSNKKLITKYNYKMKYKSPLEFTFQ